MRLKNLPNAICIVRLCMIPVLWYVAIVHERWWFVGLLAFTWFTDAIDGVIARKYHLESPLGAVLDSVSDNSVQLSMPFWLYLLVPELYTHYWYLVAIMLSAFVFSMVLQWRRRAPLHTYANKATAWLLAAFLLTTFAFGVNVIFMWFTFVCLMYALIEGILILFLRKHVSEETKTFWSPEAPKASEDQTA